MKKYFLVLAFLMVSVIALMYGVSPAWFARTFLGIGELETNIAHILRAIMCLYLALGLFWLYAAFHKEIRNVAVLTTAIFSGGLVVGRIISLFTDGQPSALLYLYTAMELLLVPVAIWIYRLPE